MPDQRSCGACWTAKNCKSSEYLWYWICPIDSVMLAIKTPPLIAMAASRPSEWLTDRPHSWTLFLCKSTRMLSKRADNQEKILNWPSDRERFGIGPREETVCSASGLRNSIDQRDTLENKGAWTVVRLADFCVHQLVRPRFMSFRAAVVGATQNIDKLRSTFLRRSEKATLGSMQASNVSPGGLRGEESELSCDEVNESLHSFTHWWAFSCHSYSPRRSNPSCGLSSGFDMKGQTRLPAGPACPKSNELPDPWEDWLISLTQPRVNARFAIAGSSSHTPTRRTDLVY